MKDIEYDSIGWLIQEIQKMRDSGEETITLFICSPGGSASPAVGFYDWIRAEKINLITVAIGQVASAALFVFLSGAKRKALLHSIFLMHPGGTLKNRLARRLLKLISPRLYRENTDFDAGLVLGRKDIFAKETKLSPEDAERFLTREHLVMTPKQALEKGFINEII